jgi:hypothetical protein
MKDWSDNIPEPNDEDLEFLAERSKRETNSSFFSPEDLKNCSYDWKDLNNKNLDIYVVESEYLINVWGKDNNTGIFYLLHNDIK